MDPKKRTARLLPALAIWLVATTAAANPLTFSVGIAPITPNAPTLTLATALDVASLDATPWLPTWVKGVRATTRADLGVALDFSTIPTIALSAIGHLDLGARLTPYLGAGIGVGIYQLGDDTRRFATWHALLGTHYHVTDTVGARIELVTTPPLGFGLHVAAEITPWR